MPPNDPNSTKSVPKPEKIEIWCHAPDAHEVFLAGDFNGWDPRATPMKHIAENWKAVLKLVPGFYSYNFVIDGKWVCDPNRMEPHDGGPCTMLITHWLDGSARSTRKPHEAVSGPE